MKNYLGRVTGALTGMVLLGSGCATTIHTSMYPNHFISPESTGGFLRGEALVGASTGQKLIIVQNAANTAAKIDPSFEGNVNFSLDTWLGLVKGLDIELLQEDLMFGAKVQVLGNSSKDAAAGNFSVALFGRYGSMDENETANDYNIFSNVTTTASSKSHRRTYDMGVSFGLRLDNEFLLTAAPFYMKRTFEGTLNSTNPISFSGVFAQYGLDSGAEWREKNLFLMRADIALTESEAYGIHSFNPFVGVEFGVHW